MLYPGPRWAERVESTWPLLIGPLEFAAIRGGQGALPEYHAIFERLAASERCRAS